MTPGMFTTARRYRLIIRRCYGSISSAHHAWPCFAVTSFSASEASSPDWRELRTRTCIFGLPASMPWHCHHTVIAEYRRHGKQESQNWGKMLSAAMKTLQRQRPFVQENSISKDAYRHGITFRRQLYGELLFWQGLKAVKSKQWKQAMICFSILGRYYPSITIKPAYQKILQLLHHTVKPSAAVPSKAPLPENSPSDCI